MKLNELNDQVLLNNIINLVKDEKNTTLQILEYLSEIDSRRLYLQEGYSSLYDFCIRYLNYSEGEAYRRIQACRIACRVKEVKPLLKNNEISLTGLSCISPYLTNDNAKMLLPEVKNKSKKEIEEVIHHHFPESKPKKEVLSVLLDNELKTLLEEAKRKYSERDITVLLKRLLKDQLRERKARPNQIKKHTRYVPASLKQEVKKEADYQCTYKCEKSVRCNQKAHLEIDHIRPFGMGGSSHDINNLRLLCKAHNQMFARRYFPNAYPRIAKPHFYSGGENGGLVTA
jgi:hypothetical protein